LEALALVKSVLPPPPPVTGITSGNLGMALRAGVTAYFTAEAFNIVGTATLGVGHPTPDFLSPAHLSNMAGHALVGCASAVAQGGRCGPGALSAAAGSFAGPILKGLKFERNLVAHAVVGGLASVAGGGNFANGAVTAAFGYLFNENGDYRERGYLDLYYRSTSEATLFPGGGFYWEVEFWAPGGEGMIIQEMSIESLIKDADGNIVSAFKKTWWEAFSVGPKSAWIGGISQTDTWKQDPTADTKGFTIMRGTARYYEGMTELPPGFKKDKMFKPAGDAPYTFDKPKLSTDVPSVTRRQGWKWNLPKK
jgi:hypothetical protein